MNSVELIESCEVEKYYTLIKMLFDKNNVLKIKYIS